LNVTVCFKGNGDLTKLYSFEYYRLYQFKYNLNLL